MDELQRVAQSIIGLAKAMGETPCAEILKLAGDGEEPVAKVSSEQDTEFPTAQVMGLLAKGLTTLTSEMQTLKAGRYPYPDKEKDKEEEEEKKKGPTTADVLTAIDKLTASVAKLATLQSAVTKASTEKQEEETEEEAAARKKKEEEEKEKETVKLSADGTPEEIKAGETPPEKSSEPDIDELVKAQVDKRLEETLQRMGFLKSDAAVIPVGTAQRPGLLSKGEGREQTLEDMEKLSKLSFREINKYRQSIGGFSRN